MAGSGGIGACFGGQIVETFDNLFSLPHGCCTAGYQFGDGSDTFRKVITGFVGILVQTFQNCVYVFFFLTGGASQRLNCLIQTLIFRETGGHLHGGHAVYKAHGFAAQFFQLSTDLAQHEFTGCAESGEFISQFLYIVDQCVERNRFD